MLSIFLKTFAMIFFAELGDKTQLTALSVAAGNPSAKWAIFLGSALALAATSLLAVLCGDLLAKIPSSDKIIKFIAGGVFIIFGTISLVEAFKS